MFSSDKKTSKIDPEQRELIENAQDRIRQKKRLMTHFVIFLAGSILVIVLDIVLGFGAEFKPFGYDWFVWVIILWAFLLLIHFINVIFVNTLMGKEWEQKQLAKLVQKQKDKIEKMQTKVEREHPRPEAAPKTAPKNLDLPSNDEPINT